MAIHRLIKVFSFSVVALLMTATQAYAQAQKLGDVINNTTNSFSEMPFVLSTVIYLLGLFFAIWGIFKFKDHVDHPQQNPLSAGVKRFLAGGMLLVAPYMYEVIHGTLFGDGGTKISNTGRHAAPTGDGMDKMIVDLISNAAGPAENLLIAFTYISGIVFLIVGITRLIKTSQDGPRGPAGLGTIITFLVSGALFAFGDMMGTFSSSLFGDATISTNASISADIISDAADRDKIAAVIEALMAFIMIVGYIAFIRGWFVLKSFADGGSGNASLAQALTFLFGGALAINLGELVNVLSKTVGVNGITFG